MKHQCRASQDGEQCHRKISGSDFQILRAGWDIVPTAYGYLYLCPRHASGKDA